MTRWSLSLNDSLESFSDGRRIIGQHGCPDRTALRLQGRFGHLLKRADTGDRGSSEPHSPLFDFEASAGGAEWIDDVARLALDARDSDATPRVVAHTDWSARNVRLRADGVRAIYDADSLSLVAGQFWFLHIVNGLGQLAASAHGIALRWEALGYLS